MPASLKLAVTADLHWGPHQAGDAATLLLAEYLRSYPPDVLVLAGDVGASTDFSRCLELFDGLPCRKALVPGNHDVWVENVDPRGDSLRVYREFLPALCSVHDFVYLDQQPLFLDEIDLAIVGTMNWYDYSWTIDQLKTATPDWEERLRRKTFTRGRHNDANFVRWPFDDAGFTAEVVGQFQRQLDDVLAKVSRAVVVTHHPPFQGLNWPRPDGPPSLDALLWEAFSGNRALETLLATHAARIPFAFCGHTHRARSTDFHAIQGHNVGGDYHFKRLLLVDLPAGSVTVKTFGEPGRTAP